MQRTVVLYATAPQKGLFKRSYSAFVHARYLFTSTKTFVLIRYSSGFFLSNISIVIAINKPAAPQPISIEE